MGLGPTKGQLGRPKARPSFYALTSLPSLVSISQVLTLSPNTWAQLTADTAVPSWILAGEISSVARSPPCQVMALCKGLRQDATWSTESQSWPEEKAAGVCFSSSLHLCHPQSLACLFFQQIFVMGRPIMGSPSSLWMFSGSAFCSAPVHVEMRTGMRSW